MSSEVVSVVVLDPETLDVSVTILEDGPTADGLADEALDSGYFCEVTDGVTRQDALDRAVETTIRAELEASDEIQKWLLGTDPELRKYHEAQDGPNYHRRFWKIVLRVLR